MMDGGSMENPLKHALTDLVQTLVGDNASISDVRREVRVLLEQQGERYRLVAVGDDHLSVRYGHSDNEVSVVVVAVPVEYIRRLPMESRP